MTAKRAEEPFVMALRALRARLHEGQAGMGARLVATEIAEGLGLSPTPVREALARLAGEGLLEDRRGQGMFVRRLTALDVGHLYRLSLAQLAIAAETPPPPGELRRTAPDAGEEVAVHPTDWVAFTETLFLGWVAQAGGRSLALTHVNLQRQLGPVRRIEPLLIPDLAEEAARLAESSPSDRAQRLRLLKAFHGRRVRLSPRIAALLESRAGEGSL